MGTALQGGFFRNPSMSRTQATGRGDLAIKAAQKAWCAKRYAGEPTLFHLERLEPRQLLTGTWTTLSNTVPSSDGAKCRCAE